MKEHLHIDALPFLPRGRFEPVASFRRRLIDNASYAAITCGQNASDPRFVKFYAELQREYRERAAERVSDLELTDDSAA